MGVEPTFEMATPKNPSPANSIEAVDAALQKLNLGQIAFKVPEVLPLKQHATVVLLLSPTQSAGELTATLRQETAQGEKVESAHIQISGLMEAKLIGPAFAIHAITPEEPQMVSRTEPTEWKWDVEPKTAGNQDLHLTINAIVKFDGVNRPRTIRSFDRVIRVDVPASSFSVLAGSGRIWGLTMLLVLIGAGAIAAVTWRRRRQATGSDHPRTAARVALDEAHDLFVSYSRRDQTRVLALTKLLESRGLKVWIDQHRLDGAAHWPKEVTEALIGAKVFVLIVSEASVKSDNVIRELSLASEEAKTILPLQLEAVEIPSSIRYQLAGIQYLILDPRSPEENINQIMRALTKLGVGPSSDRTVEAPPDKFIAS
jgi:hypothetical protein